MLLHWRNGGRCLRGRRGGTGGQCQDTDKARDQTEF